MTDSTASFPNVGRLWRAALGVTLIVAALQGACVSPGLARSPMLMDGKRTLVQRVLIRPGAVARPRPDIALPGEPIEPFSAYFVYDRVSDGGAEWVEIGSDREGTRTVFVETAKTIDWKQTMTLLFTNPATRMDADGPRLSLIFDRQESLSDLLQSEALVPTSRKWRSEARAARAARESVPPGNPVVAVEPEEHADFRENFYLLPVLEAKNTLVRELRAKLLLMRIASLREQENAPQPPPDLRDLRVGVVFVVDTSASMNKYIDRTRQAIRQVFDKIRASELRDQFSLGMVGFRDSVEAVPGLAYRTKVYAELTPILDPDRFLNKVAEMAEAGVSSLGFMEDALGGLDAAMSMSAWSEFDAKFLILITDASTRNGSDPLASVHLEPREFNSEAQAKNFAIQVLHLKTPGGVNDHPIAQGQYSDLARFGDINLYRPIDAGSLAGFGEKVDAAADTLIDTMISSLANRRIEPAPQGGAPDPMRQAALAMQLAYIGQQTGAQAPDIIDGWIIDRDFENLRAATVDPRVLLTKNQLNDLKVTIQSLIDLQRSNRLHPREFFTRLQSVAGNMVRDPSRIATGQIETLGDVLGEYLEGLPYESEVMGLTEQDFLSMGPVRQDQLVRSLKSKVESYRRFNEESDLWIKLSEDAPEGERVYPVPLRQLP